MSGLSDFTSPVALGPRHIEVFDGSLQVFYQVRHRYFTPLWVSVAVDRSTALPSTIRITRQASVLTREQHCQWTAADGLMPEWARRSWWAVHDVLSDIADGRITAADSPSDTLVEAVRDMFAACISALPAEAEIEYAIAS